MPSAVTVTTGARLHFGPLACGAGVGRRFGGIGLMVDTPRVRMRVGRASTNLIRSTLALEKRLAAVRDAALEALPALDAVRIDILDEIPPHRGFGAGTQTSLALAAALSLLAGERDIDELTLAERAGRGDRSAIGVHGFRRGGFLVDAGKLPGDPLGALACRVRVPEAWRIVIVSPHPEAAHEGLSGESERMAFARIPPMSAETSGRLSRIVVAEILPALESQDADAFQTALTDYGCLVGEYFSPIQGSPFCDSRLWECSESRRCAGLSGLVQTSWGPTAAICCRDERTAERTERELQGDLGPAYRTQIVRPRNGGAEIQVSPSNESVPAH
jgi:beta-ribofuranosylaminobenzene 5'-phosphate synthase